jgi:hypothetical protein
VDHDRRFKGKVPQHEAALADTPRVMGEVLDGCADLYDATKALGEALVDADLPRRAWRSEQAALHLLSDALPKIPVGAFLTRLEEFATRKGPTWLQGDHRDLAEFHEEVDILSDVARPLQDVVHRLQRAPVGPWTDHPLQRTMRQPRLQTPLDNIVEILGDFEALAPFMRPITPEQWRALLQSQARGPLQAGVRPGETTASRLRTHRLDGVLSSSPVKAVAATVHSVLGAISTWLLQRVSSLRRWPRAARLLAAAGLLLVVAVAVLTLSHRSHTPPQVSSASSTSTALRALAGSGRATASATGSRAPSPPAGATAPAGSTPKLALTCVLNGAMATLTVNNQGSSSFTWQVQSPPTLTVLPAQGTLEAGQSATVQVSAKNKKTATGTITVTASHDTVSTQEKVSCR